MPGLPAERVKLLRDSLRDIDAAPRLRRVNGVGLTLLGTMRDPAMTPYIIKMYWFTFLFIPLVPIRCYLVQEHGGDSFGFAKSLGLYDFHRIFFGRLIRFYFFLLLESVFFFVAIVLALGLALFATYAIRRGFR